MFPLYKQQFVNKCYILLVICTAADVVETSRWAEEEMDIAKDGMCLIWYYRNEWIQWKPLQLHDTFWMVRLDYSDSETVLTFTRHRQVNMLNDL